MGLFSFDKMYPLGRVQSVDTSNVIVYVWKCQEMCSRETPKI